MLESFYNNLIVEDRYRMILDGLQVTLVITVCAVILGTILGGLVCWMRMSRRPWLQKVAKVYIDIMRGTPVLVVLMLMYYVIMAPLEATGIVVAIVTFGMNTAAYIGEMLRTGIEGIDKGQTEAGLALGYTPRQTFFRIVLPQVVKAVMPVYQGAVISLLKGTSIVGYIAVQDMTRASDLIRSRTFDAFFPLILTAIIYFFLAWLIGRLLTALSSKKYKKAAVAAALLLLGGTVCYIPTLTSTGKDAARKEVPAVFQALKGKRVCVVLGSIQDIAVSEMSPNADIQRVSSMPNMFMTLESGKSDIIVAENLLVTFDKDLAAKVDTVGAGIPPIPLGAIFRLGNTELQQDFNSFLSAIRADGTYQEIYDRWRNAEDISTRPLPVQRGTGKTLTVAVAPDTAPFNFISSGAPAGLEIDFLTEWANRRNWKLEYLAMEFPSLIPAIQTGKADLAMGVISATEERKKQVLFSDGYLASHIVFMTRKGEAGILTEPALQSAEQAGGHPWALIVCLILGGGFGLFCIALYLRRKSLARQAAAFQTESQPADAPIIRISHLKKSYGSLEVLKDINADVRRGEVISVIGPSGTGKSTLLRALNLLDPPTGGSVFVHGKDILAKGY
ncbi:MAG: ABC transporter permease subunit, partial [Bacteroidales bacterium]|nr:ABC transporter permease subunit [Bacteroidales bacterium]